MFPLGTGEQVSKLVFYAQSTTAVISGRYTLCHYTIHPVVSISIVIKVAMVFKVPSEIKRSGDFRGGRWNWTFKLAQKRS